MKAGASVMTVRTGVGGPSTTPSALVARTQAVQVPSPASACANVVVNLAASAELFQVLLGDRASSATGASHQSRLS